MCVCIPASWPSDSLNAWYVQRRPASQVSIFRDALDDTGRTTPLNRDTASYPCDPKYGTGDDDETRMAVPHTNGDAANIGQSIEGRSVLIPLLARC